MLIFRRLFFFHKNSNNMENINRKHLDAAGNYSCEVYLMLAED